MEREIEDLTTQQPEVLLVPEGIQLNYEFMGIDLLVLVPSGDWGTTAQLVAVDGFMIDWKVLQPWGWSHARQKAQAFGGEMAVADLERHVAAHRPLIEMLAAMSEPAGDGEDHQDQDDDEQDGSEVHAALVPASEEIEP